MYLYEVYVRRVVIVLRPSNRKSPAREQSSSSTKRARIISSVIPGSHALSEAVRADRVYTHTCARMMWSSKYTIYSTAHTLLRIIFSARERDEPASSSSSSSGSSFCTCSTCMCVLYMALPRPRSHDILRIPTYTSPLDF
ncbi:unnamed protein product [Trichogramma brassicae]|uniref:Uncharacterized protein n=1 Tax=Trichogramma brassicae TaxID=86971 RepID=A0A6H5J2W6_9HYME|nr:unnamed protein product [Trichogramma brassicae]